MADEIKLKAPTVEQQVVVNISGEDKLRSFSDTLEKISNNKNLQKYWKTQQELINATADAYGNFSKKASKDNATELIKVTNALKAMLGTDLSNVLPDFDKIAKSMSDAQKVVGNLDSAFSVNSFKDAFSSFETLKAYGVDIQNFFNHFGVSFDVDELQNNVRVLENEVERLSRRLLRAKETNEELRNEFESFKIGSGFSDKLDELDNLKSEMESLRNQAKETFEQFLKLNNISIDGYDEYGEYDDNRFRKYFVNIQNGYLSASDAISQFKREYAYLIEESFKSNNDTFGLEQLQLFSNKLDNIFHQVEETSNKINDIISNGVITKSIENLSVDNNLSNQQRSLFDNLLQDEESLKSITALIQKLIEESNQTKNTELFDEEQFDRLLVLFEKIESSISSIKAVLVDVGDGEELSPLLKMIDNVQSSVKELSTSVSGIKLDVNMDLGSEVNERLNQKVSQSLNRQLEAYRNFFSAMKSTGKTNKEMLRFFEPDDASISEIIGTYKGIIKRAEEQFGKDVYKNKIGKDAYSSYVKEIKNATDQFNRATNKKNTENPLGDLFGKTDLTEVVSQLEQIVIKLDEISQTAGGFKDLFSNGLNVSTSIEEVGKLTNRVKELEDELAKIKITPVVDGNKSNISSGNSTMKDVFQDGSDSSSTAVANEEVSAMEKVETATEQAAQAKQDFVTANQNVQSSVDGSKSPLQLEAELMQQIAKDARDAADAKKEFVEANKQVEQSANDSNDSMNSGHSDNAEPSGTKRYKKKGYKAHDTGNHDNEETVAKKSELGATLKKLQSEIIASIDESTSFIKEVTDFYDSANDLVKTQMKVVDKDGSQRTYTTSYSKDGDDFKAWTSHIDTQKFKNTEEQEAKEIQKAWNEANKAVTDYLNAKSKLNNLEATDTKSGNVKNQIDAQKQKVEELESKAEETRKTLSDMLGVHDIDDNAWSNFLKLIQDFEEAGEGSSQSMAKLKDTIANVNTSELQSLDKYIESAQKKLDETNASRKDSEKSSYFKDYISEIQGYINGIIAERDKLDEAVKSGDIKIIDSKNLSTIDDFKQKITEANLKYKTMFKGAPEISSTKVIQKMTKYLTDFTGISKDAKKHIKELINLLETDMDANPKDVLNTFLKLATAEKAAGRECKSFLDVIKDKAWYGFAAQIGTYFSFNDIMRYWKEGIETVRELDTALTEMRKVSEESVSSLKNYQAATFDVADAVGTTAVQIQNSTADWQRLGYTLSESAALAKNSNIYKNVGDMEIEEATEHMVSSVQAWKSEFNDNVIETSQAIIDRYNEVKFLPLCA